MARPDVHNFCFTDQIKFMRVTCKSDAPLHSLRTEISYFSIILTITCNVGLKKGHKLRSTLLHCVYCAGKHYLIAADVLITRTTSLRSVKNKCYVVSYVVAMNIKSIGLKKSSDFGQKLPIFRVMTVDAECITEWRTFRIATDSAYVSVRKSGIPNRCFCVSLGHVNLTLFLNFIA